MSILLAACIILAVHDGDTLTAKCEKRVKPLVLRVAEIDAPEYAAFKWGDQPGRTEARDTAVALCRVGGPAKVRLNLFDKRTSRWIAHVECRGFDLSYHLASNGLVWPYIVDKKTRITGAVRDAQDRAVGLWVRGGAPVAPTVWRSQGMHQPAGVNLP